MIEEDSPLDGKKDTRVLRGAIVSILIVAGWCTWHYLLQPIVHDSSTVERQVHAKSAEYNGFDLSTITIPIEEVLSGGPPRDGIPAIVEPKFVSIDKSTFLEENDIVISFSHNGENKAYPLKILTLHEVVNDTVGGKPVAITYCPLCGTSIVFERVYKGIEHTFGVSGLLYNSDVLLYDHQGESLWSQLKMEAVSGKSAGQPLQWIPSTEMTWKAWKTQYPKGIVLSTETGFKRNYTRPVYQSYFDSPETLFPVPFTRKELRKKDWVIGIKVGDSQKAYPLKALLGIEGGELIEEFKGTMIRIRLDAESQEINVTDMKSEKQLSHVKLYWFAWQAFYPNTALYME